MDQDTVVSVDYNLLCEMVSDSFDFGWCPEFKVDGDLSIKMSFSVPFTFVITSSSP